MRPGPCGCIPGRPLDLPGPARYGRGSDWLPATGDSAPAGRTDLRVLLIGEKIAGAMALAPAEGDFRSNFHVSGQSWPFDLTREIEQMALAVGRADHRFLPQPCPENG
ncbi:MAG: hypothetical protein R6U41_07875 [Desulfosalsimonas sp.]|uniref:hypothetical protein n=1 Tax=Desulfosalsimonas sp. TaxID=3073848 RepID=UPI00397097E9